MSAAAPISGPPKLSWKKRLGLFALSLVSSPIVYLYLGHPRPALTVVVVACAIYAAIIFGPASIAVLPGAIEIFVLCIVLMIVVPVIDGFFLARRGRAQTGRPYQRWWTYLSLLVVLAIPGEAAMRMRAQDKVTLRSFDIASGSMEPSLLLGDYLFSVMNAWQDQPIQRGDIVYFLHEHAYWVKRVIGLPGDTIALADGFVSLNGMRLERAEIGPWARGGESSADDPQGGLLYRETIAPGRSYTIGKLQPGPGPFDEMAAVTVPPDTLFVLGDNRDNSLDSRMPQVGFVPMSRVRGRPVLIYWSRERGRIGLTPQ